MDKIRIASLNVRGLNDEHNRKELFNLMRQDNYDIICFQEMHSSPETIQRWKYQWPGQMFYAHGTSKTAGTCILIKEKIDLKPEIVVNDTDGRYNVLKLQIGQQTVHLMNVYAPNDDDPNFFLNLFKTIENVVLEE